MLQITDKGEGGGGICLQLIPTKTATKNLQLFRTKKIITKVILSFVLTVKLLFLTEERSGKMLITAEKRGGSAIADIADNGGKGGPEHPNIDDIISDQSLILTYTKTNSSWQGFKKCRP